MSANYKTPVMVIQEYAMKKKISVPKYNPSVDIDKHYNQFSCKVEIAGMQGTGSGRSKKVAKQNAAFNALEKIVCAGMYDVEDYPPKDFDPNLYKCENDNKINEDFNLVVFLHECCTHNKLPQPLFCQLSDVGPPHCRQFTYECKISSLKTLSTKNTKEQAKQMAAKLMIEKIMKIIPNLSMYISDWKKLMEKYIEEKKKKKKEKDGKVIKNKVIENNGIENNGIENNAIENNGIENNVIENNGIENNEIENNVIENNEIENNVIENNGIENNGIENNGIKNNGIENNGIENNGIENNGIENIGIETNGIENNVIDNEVVENNKAKIVDFPNCLKGLMKKNKLNINDFKELLKLQDEYGVINILDMLGLQHEIIKLQDNPIVLVLNINVDTVFTVMVKGTSEDAAKEDLFKHTMAKLKSYMSAATY